MYMTIPKEDVWMKKSFQIFKRDLGRLFRNRAAVLILVGISVLPSLYAWFNIAANMDPYGNTKGIQVAIANEDKGADSEQMSLDAGQNIVDNLKKNDQLGWKFAVIVYYLWQLKHWMEKFSGLDVVKEIGKEQGILNLSTKYARESTMMGMVVYVAFFIVLWIALKKNTENKEA